MQVNGPRRAGSGRMRSSFSKTGLLERHSGNEWLLESMLGP